MDEHDLFAAIDAVDDAYLLEIEQSKIRRLPKHFGLIAAMLALLLTACAAPMVIRSFDKVQRGGIVESEHDRIREVVRLGDGTVLETTPVYYSGTVELEVEVDPEAPDNIEEHRLPVKMTEIYTVEEYTDSETEFTISFSGNGVKGRRYYDILYRQCVLPKDGHTEVRGILSVGSFTQAEKAYGDASVLEFYGHDTFNKPKGTNKHGIKYYDADTYELSGCKARYIFWSDGMYLYCLKIPICPPINGDSDIEEIIGSLTTVENLSEYLS